MKLLRCSVENFGTLSSFEREFKPGLTVFLEENGFGKTTLAAFIKAMFYGLPVSTKRSLDENERKRYTPWQGGVFGGSLDFEVDGHAYRVERRFEPKGKDDAFTLIDLVTGKVSSDYSENLGEELFGLDAEAFSRTTYLSQRGLAAGMTNSISARLTGMVENTDDVRNYDTAVRALDERRRFYGLKRGTGGETARLAGEQETLRRRLQTQREDLQNLQATWEKGQQARKKLQPVEEELATVNRQKEAAAEQRAAKTVEEQRSRLVRSVEEKEQQEKRYVTFFAHGIPTPQELEHCREQAELAASLRRQITEAEQDTAPHERLQQAQRFFKNHVPSEYELSGAAETLKQYEEMALIVNGSVLSPAESQRLALLRARFQKHALTREEISAARRSLAEYAFICRERDSVRQEAEALQAQPPIQAAPPVALWVLAGILAVVGVLLLVLQPLGFWPGAAALVGAVAVAVGSIVVKHRREEEAQHQRDARQSRLDAMLQKGDERAAAAQNAAQKVAACTAPFGLKTVNEQTEPLLLELDAALSELGQLEENETRLARVRAQYTESIKQPRETLNRFFGQYFALENLQYSQALQELRERLHDLRRCQEDLQAYEKRLEQLRARESEAQTGVLNFFDRYHLPKIGRMERLGDAVVRIRDGVREASETHAAADEARAALAAFNREHPNEAVDPSLPAPEVLEEKAQNLQELRDKVLRFISACDAETARMDRVSEEADQTEAELAQCEEQLQLANQHFDTLTHTIEWLEKARTSLNVRYKDTITKQFNHYMQAVDAGFGEAAMDADLRVSARRYGAARPAEAFSEGYRALMDICLRLAVTDALFPGEKPLLILDDPFATLDEEKIHSALKVLLELSKQRQILYLVCHRSRV